MYKKRAFSPMIGDCVIYRQSCLCCIRDIRTEVFPHAEEKVYYILSPLSDEKTTVFLPVDRIHDPAYLRAPLTKEQIEQAIRDSRTQTLEWINDHKQRGAFFRKILSEANPVRLLLLYKALEQKREESIRAKQKFSTADEKVAVQVREMILQEYSFALKLSSEEITEYINKELDF